MLDLSTIVGKGKPHADALSDAEAAENFWDSLPRHDPIEMQRRLCDELAKGARWDKLDINRFRALRVLDRRAGACWKALWRNTRSGTDSLRRSSGRSGMRHSK
jgi:hypothetical protein